MTHIICRKTKDELGASYAVKVPAKVYEAYGEEFLRFHFNFLISQALADLIVTESYQDWNGFNKQLAFLKFEKIPHYAEVLKRILPPFKEAAQEHKEDGE